MKRCSKHPKYKGNKAPTNQCGECLSLYTALKGHRVPIPPPNKVHRDKSKFYRKEKHKKDLE